MGYAKTVGSNLLELYSEPEESTLLTTVQANRSLNHIHIPRIQGEIVAAYNDIIFNGIKNENIAENSWLLRYISVSNDNVNFHDTFQIHQVYWIPASSKVIGQFRIYGQTDVKDYIVNGGTWYCRWTNAGAELDQMYVYDMSHVLRIYFA